MAYVAFFRLTKPQRVQAIELRRGWRPSEFARTAFWVCADGHVSRRNGHHQLTDEAGAAVDLMLRGDDVRTRGDLRDYRTAAFTMAPER
jgi:hypothetical protein